LTIADPARIVVEVDRSAGEMEGTMKRLTGVLGAMVLLGSVGVGTVSADPINKNSRYFSANCDGAILDFVTQSGAAAQVLSDGRVVVLQGATEDGVWILPISNGQSKADLVECVYTQLFDGHQFVIYVKLVGG
jgi:hypothetical protein